MESKKAVLGISILMICMFIGCNTIPIVAPTSTVSPTKTPVSKVSPTETPKIYESPTLTATVENTPIPTLSSIESENYVKELLETNAGCSLPCIWGIDSGKSSYIDAQRFFKSLGWKGSESHGVYYTGKDLEGVFLGIRVGVYAVNGVVEKMHIAIGGKDFLSLVKYFSIGNILQAFGKPTKLFIFIGTNPGVLEPNETSFETLLYYEAKNTLIQYPGTAVKVGNNYRFCLAQPNAESSQVDHLSGYVSLYVGQGDQIGMPETLVQPFGVLPDYYISPEKAFGISIDKFYEVATQPNGKVCFDSPLSAWRR